MAFDMYIGNERAFVDHHEEGIFELINDDDKYPKLNWVWEQFYDGPHISPETSNDLIHELIVLRAELVSIGNSKHLISVVDRLLPFFSMAYKSGKEIKCKSD